MYSKNSVKQILKGQRPSSSDSLPLHMGVHTLGSISELCCCEWAFGLSLSGTQNFLEYFVSTCAIFILYHADSEATCKSNMHSEL